MLKNLEKVMGVLEHYREPHIMRDRPGHYRERLREMAFQATIESPGDILEIGAHIGLTTIVLLHVAERTGRRVIVVDPWETGTPGCRGFEHEEFLERVRPWKDLLTVHRVRSDNPQVVETIKATSLCFALVDGLHTHDVCLEDIQNVSHSHLIVVDDTHLKAVSKALQDGAKNIGRRVVTAYELGIREGYILPGG
jgi:hypothetical protein